MAKAEKMLTPRRSYGNVDCSLIPWTVWRMLEKILLRGYQKALKLPLKIFGERNLPFKPPKFN